MRPEKFFVGVDTHMIGINIPIMVSDLRLKRVVRLKRSAGPVMIDSGSFTIHDKGMDFDPPVQYVDRARRYMAEVGNVVSVATYGEMCEEWILAKTGRSILRNQEMTIESYCTLLQLAPDVPWLPELQGFQEEEYHRCVDMYSAAGVDLTKLPAVGLGSICRREGTEEARRIARSIAARGITLHGFGVKDPKSLDSAFTSADSFAWSYGARKRTRECPHGIVKWERNCPEYLRNWRDKILAGMSSTLDVGYSGGMSENTETQTENVTPAVQEYEDGSEVAVTRGTKNLPNGEILKVLGFDTVTGKYSVRRSNGRLAEVAAGNVGPKPERTFTESEVREFLAGQGLNADALVDELTKVS